MVSIPISVTARSAHCNIEPQGPVQDTSEPGDGMFTLPALLTHEVINMLMEKADTSASTTKDPKDHEKENIGTPGHGGRATTNSTVNNQNQLKSLMKALVKCAELGKSQ